jgi:tetratricopeptide (TPR) repeat protein
MRRIRTERWGRGAVLVGCGLLLGVTLGAQPIWADEGAARAVAREHFQRGVALAKRRVYAEALSEFQQAYVAVPHFSVLYNIGQAQIALGQRAEAIATLQRYLDEAGVDIDAQRRSEVEQVLARERAKMPPLAASTEAPPHVATSPATPLPTVEPSPPAVAAAEPRVELQDSSVAPGPVAPTQTQAVRRLPKARPARARPARAPKASAASQRTLAYVVGAAGLALSGGAVAHYVWNRGRYQEWQGKYAAFYRDPTAPNRRDANELSDSIDHASAVTVVLAVGAGVALGTSGVLWVTSSPPSSDQHARGLEPFFHWQGTF